MSFTFFDKIDALRRRLRELESAVVAFSGGVDSSVLAVIARQELRDRMIAATSVSASMPRSDESYSADFCARHGIPHRQIETAEFCDPNFTANNDDRCYHCKRHLYEGLLTIADSLGFRFVVEGTNSSDLGGHRPGNKASKENERVATPLIDCSFTKTEVRELAKILGLDTASKPSAACLSSRVPTGVEIGPQLLRRIDAAEDIVRSLGAKQVRVRHHGDIARIEVEGADMPLCAGCGAELTEKIKALGWKFVTLDLQGYRTGGMRE